MKPIKRNLCVSQTSEKYHFVCICNRDNKNNIKLMILFGISLCDWDAGACCLSLAYSDSESLTKILKQN